MCAGLYLSKWSELQLPYLLNIYANCPSANKYTRLGSIIGTLRWLNDFSKSASRTRKHEKVSPDLQPPKNKICRSIDQSPCPSPHPKETEPCAFKLLRELNGHRPQAVHAASHVGMAVQRCRQVPEFTQVQTFRAGGPECSAQIMWLYAVQHDPVCASSAARSRLSSTHHQLRQVSPSWAHCRAARRAHNVILSKTADAAVDDSMHRSKVIIGMHMPLLHGILRSSITAILQSAG